MQSANLKKKSSYLISNACCYLKVLKSMLPVKQHYAPTFEAGDVYYLNNI